MCYVTVAEKRAGKRMLLPSKFDRSKDSWEKKDLERGCSETRALYQFARTRYIHARIFTPAADAADLEIAEEYLGMYTSMFVNVCV